MADRVGQQLGNYRLVRLLGQGGFAEVYLGEHIHLNTQAAIKVLRTQLSSEDVANFHIEARTIAHLVHPNIVQVLDFGVENGTPFLVMAYAPNGTLRQRHRRGQPLPAPTIISYVKQVAAALQYAHNQKLIHRDVKPENMLVARNDEILLSDFGIALPTASAREQGMLEQNAPPDQSTWNPIGTVTYMAPEQIQGKPTPASDQYALAVVVYEWICGQAPFNGTYVEIAMQKISTPPDSLRAKVPDLPPDVEQVVLTALATDPQRRFKTVQAFALALEQAYYPAAIPALSSTLDAVLIGPAGRIELKGEVISIGRKSSNQVALQNDLKVSSRHAELRLVGKDYCLVDLDSTNGTLVNGEKLAPRTLRVLKSGDKLLIGDTAFTYEVRGAEKEEPASDGSTVRAEEPAPAAPAAQQPAVLGHTGYGNQPAPAVAAQPPQPAAPGSFTPVPITPPPMYTPLPPAQPFYNPSAGNSGAMPPVSTPPAYPVPGGNSGAMFPVQPAPGPVSSGQSGAMPRVQSGAGFSGAAYGPGPATPLPPGGPVILPGSPASQPGLSPLPAKPSAGAQVRLSRNRLWMILAVILVVVLVAASSIGFVAYHNAQPTPAKTLAAFCTALTGKDSATAWSQFSPKLQSAVTQPIFNAFFSGTSTCTPGTPAQNNTSATTTLALASPARSATDNVTLTQQNDGSWKIENESGISGLVQMLTSFCSAMQQGDYTAAYSQFSGHLQSTLPQAQFTLYFPKASTCTYSSLLMVKGGAQITISQAGASGPTDNNSTSLVEENGNWKIDGFANLPDKMLTTFCADLQSGNYQDAYNQTSTAFQGGYPESTFAQQFSIFSSCSYNPPAMVNGSLTSDMTFALKAGNTVPFTSFLVRDSNTAKWKIDNLVNFPDQTLNTFCTDLDNQDYADAYTQIAPDTQAVVSEQAFAQSFSNVTRCSHTFPQQSGSSATSSITLTLNTGKTVTRTATLVEVGAHNWKIQSIN
jgi:serine/threonine protein kinase/limonene-1,2-epoxide hydrolase